MHFRALIVAVGISMLHGPTASCQSPPNQDSRKEAIVNPFGSLLGGDVMRAANDFRMGSEALDRFGRALASINSRVAEAMVEISENLADASTGFDPFGFKTAFQTIQRQNEILHEQSATIQELQQQEIRRLRKELKRSKRGT
jgi:hypothetical protein